MCQNIAKGQGAAVWFAEQGTVVSDDSLSLAEPSVISIEGFGASVARSRGARIAMSFLFNKFSDRQFFIYLDT